MKACFKCGEVQPLSNFYKHKTMADGHLNKCKTCTKKDVKVHRIENIEEVREYDRDRAKLPHRVALNTANTKLYRAAHPDRMAANNAVARALKAGKLKRFPCWECGALDVEAHHFDYSTPLAVTWLCAVHHREIHLKHAD